MDTFYANNLFLHKKFINMCYLNKREGILMQKILIVEDDIDIQDILKNHLTDAGYEVVIAADGVAGIAEFDDTISLVLLDNAALQQ